MFLHSLVFTASFLAIQASMINYPPTSLPQGEDVMAGRNLNANKNAYTDGFINPSIEESRGGAATCVTGLVPVSAFAQNFILTYDSPANSSVVTSTILEFLQIGSNFLAKIVGPKVKVSGTWQLSGKLCYPKKSGPNADLVQILTHGVGFDKLYWDFYDASYSYQDAAAVAGFTTFAYDRLGVGNSDHPDPLAVVQAPLETALAHGLIQSLRHGDIGGVSFKQVVGVGHSLGSEVTHAVTREYPDDLDAAVLTGFTTDFKGQPNFFAAVNFGLACSINEDKFGHLDNGYVVGREISGNQFGFFYSPNFNPVVLAASEEAKQTLALGELFTNTWFVAPAKNFSGPVAVVNGGNDLPFCQSNCLYPVDKGVATLKELYPNASDGSSTYISEGVGHGINLHYSAQGTYAHIFQFIRDNGLEEP